MECRFLALDVDVCFWHKADIGSKAAFILVAHPLMPTGRDQ